MRMKTPRSPPNTSTSRNHQLGELKWPARLVTALGNFTVTGTELCKGKPRNINKNNSTLVYILYKTIIRMGSTAK